MISRNGTVATYEPRLPGDGSLHEEAPKTEITVYAAAGLSLVAAMIHLWALPEHVLFWWGYGVFFLGVALAQGVCAVLILRWPGVRVFSAAIWGNASVIVLYVVTRTSGVPLGPHAGKIEDAGLLDMAATVAEFGVVLALAASLTGASRRWTINALLLLGAAMWVLRLSGALS